MEPYYLQIFSNLLFSSFTCKFIERIHSCTISLYSLWICLSRAANLSIFERQNKQEMKRLKVGEKAPNFEGTIEDGSTVSLNDYQGKKLILFIYPKDNTPGCNAQNCNLAENYDALREKGFELLGMSADDETKHQKFIAKFNLPFHLIADTEHKIIEDYGSWGLKKFMGREYDGIHRTTFIIEDGVITHTIEKVKTKAHTEQILDLVGE